MTILHCDAQGAELSVLEQATPLFRAGRVEWLFPSTHHHAISGDPLTHQRCLALLRSLGARLKSSRRTGELFGRWFDLCPLLCGTGWLEGAQHQLQPRKRIPLSSPTLRSGSGDTGKGTFRLARLAIRNRPVVVTCATTQFGVTPICSLGLGNVMAVKDVKKVVLAYSGGLDTSVILRWLQTTYRCEVVTFTADLGQGEELGPARQKAEMFGVKEIFVDDLRETFVRDFVFPMFRANALYEGQYLLGTSIARPLIAQRQIEIAEQVGADAVAHGATGKGNDQVRFELVYYALKPDIKIIAPWREWDLTSRTRLLEFAEQNQIPIAKDKRGEAPFSVDANLLHSSSEGKILEDPAIEADEIVYQRTIRPEDAPDKATVIADRFRARRCGGDRRRATVARPRC